MNTKEITIFHSPDADDAFMFYGLTSGAVSHPDFTFRHDLCDIESLNRRTLAGELDVTAVSVHALPYLKGQYSVLTCGASMGEKDYGPRVLVRRHEKRDLTSLRSIAIPGKYTSAALAMQMWLLEHGATPEIVNIHFDEIQQAVKAGDVEAGVIIHEGQITHHKDDLLCVLDLGAWWWENHTLPLPLGVNVIRKSLGDQAIYATKDVLARSIQHSLENREQALEYALSYGRGLSHDEADTFVGMYVNDRTVDLGPDGRRSIELFLKEGFDMGIIPHLEVPTFV